MRGREEGEGENWAKKGDRKKEESFEREARAAPRREEGDKGAGGGERPTHCPPNSVMSNSSEPGVIGDILKH